MDNIGYFFFGAIVGAMLLAVLLAASGMKHPSVWEKRAIDHGAGQYNPQTGAFEWLTPETAPVRKDFF
jgi:formate/nitrite transporter FocA (FNT family)